MSADFQIRVEDGMLVTSVIGPLEFGDTNRAIAASAQAARAAGTTRILADLRRADISGYHSSAVRHAEIALPFRRTHGRWYRVATKYLNLTRRFFAAKGLADYRIVESLGATEGTPAAGTAELIVDITTTGTTLAANGLRILDDGLVLRSEANLIASRSAVWTPALEDVMARIAAGMAAT